MAAELFGMMALLILGAFLLICIYGGKVSSPSKDGATTFAWPYFTSGGGNNASKDGADAASLFPFTSAFVAVKRPFSSSGETSIINASTIQAPLPRVGMEPGQVLRFPVTLRVNPTS